ncbi:MAG TPA: NAD(P)/FAD-dependent oxidoreductase [Kofleriaceae bacterium]|nr:NAD(P)/FAD-dependent oxidoreductase [Kofleriaceae bacterium]
MSKPYDAIIVGARCAGSPLAMLLARKGHRVLVVDKTSFPSDTLSTHVVHPRPVAALQRWGLLDQLVATGCPPIHTYDFHFGPLVLSGAPGTPESPVAYCPRRTVFDKILVDAAAAAGAEVRTGFAVDEILEEDGRVVGIAGHDAGGGARITERARVVIGADGRYSMVAKAVHAQTYNERPPLQGGFYSYWSDLPMNGRFETFIGDGLGFAAAPTHDDLTMVVGGWKIADWESRKQTPEASYDALTRSSPEFAERMRDARRVDRVHGAASANFFRKPYGPGWALVGDAGYHKDPITAQGILDAFRDAEGCAGALDAVFRGERTFDAAMAGFQRARDEEVLPMYELTLGIAAMAPPPPEMQAVFGAIHGNQAAMDGFARVNAGTTSPAAFFAPDSIGPIMAAAGARAARG